MWDDTINANTTDHDGSTCAQLFVGMKSMFTSVNGMKPESNFPSALMDFIQSFGAMKGKMRLLCWNCRNVGDALSILCVK
jgi:hypothetical protein